MCSWWSRIKPEAIILKRDGAAAALGESRQTLSFILKHKFPELYLELGINRKPRKIKRPERKKDIFDGPSVQHVMVPESIKFLYDFVVQEEGVISTFLVSHELTEKLGLVGSKLLAVARIKEDLRPDVPVLYQRSDGNYNIGQLIYDILSSLFVIQMGEDEFVFLSDVTIVGVSIGYCDMKDMNRKRLKFKKIIFE